MSKGFNYGRPPKRRWAFENAEVLEDSGTGVIAIRFHNDKEIEEQTIFLDGNFAKEIAKLILAPVNVKA